MELFDRLPDGCHLLRRWIGIEDQRKLVELSRQLTLTHPLMTPSTKGGHPMALKVTSWGKVGWMGRMGNYEYMYRHLNGYDFPKVPYLVNHYIESALVFCGFKMINLDTVLLNWYPKGTGRLGKHADVTEQDQVSPITTISLGESCKFVIGSTDYADKGQTIQIDSGDVFVMGKASRLAYHEVKALIPGSSDLLKNGGRISLTGRQVFV